MKAGCFSLIVFLFISMTGCLTKMQRYERSTSVISSDKVAQLKATQTVFFLNTHVPASLDSFKQCIREGWTLTPVIFDDIDNLDKYVNNPKYSCFILQNYTRAVENYQPGRAPGYQPAAIQINQPAEMNYENTYFYLSLYLLNDIKRKGKLNLSNFCRIELFPNFRTMKMGSYYSSRKNLLGRLYDTGMFYNWTPVLLKAQLQAASTNISNGQQTGVFEDLRDGRISSLLRKDTLYVPGSVLINFNMFSGKEAKKEENIFEKYPYPYRICTDSELYNIFETQKTGRLLFEYVKSSTEKLVSVYDMKDKKIIYRDHTGFSYNLKSGDIQKLASAGL